MKTHDIKPTTVTKEHKIPRCKNGKDHDANYAAACSRCNFMRGDLPAKTFTTVLEKLFQVSFIRKNWHTTDKDTFRFIRKMFRFEVDHLRAFDDRAAAIRSISRRHKYSIDELLATGIPLEELIPTVGGRSLQ